MSDHPPQVAAARRKATRRQELEPLIPCPAAYNNRRQHASSAQEKAGAALQVPWGSGTVQVPPYHGNPGRYGPINELFFRCRSSSGRSFGFAVVFAVFSSASCASLVLRAQARPEIIGCTRFATILASKPPEGVVPAHACMHACIPSQTFRASKPLCGIQHGCLCAFLQPLLLRIHTA